MKAAERALYDAMHDTRSQTRPGNEFDNEGQWEEGWVPAILEALAERGFALVDVRRSACCAETEVAHDGSWAFGHEYRPPVLRGPDYQ